MNFPAPPWPVDWYPFSTCWWRSMGGSLSTVILGLLLDSIEWLKCLRNTNERVLDLWCKFKDVRFSILDNTVTFSYRAISCSSNSTTTSRMSDWGAGGRFTSTRTTEIAHSTATSGKLMKMLGMWGGKNGMECRGSTNTLIHMWGLVIFYNTILRRCGLPVSAARWGAHISCTSASSREQLQPRSLVMTDDPQ